MLHPMFMKFLQVPVISLCLFMSTVSAADYLGPEAVLNQAFADSKAKTVAVNRVAVFRAAIEKQAQAASTQSAKEAVAGWLALVDAYFNLPQKVLEQGRGQYVWQGLSMKHLLIALPPPSAWDELRVNVQKRPLGKNSRRELALRLMVNILLGDKDAQVSTIGAFDDHMEDMEEDGSEHLREILKRHLEAIQGPRGETKDIMVGLNEQLELEDQDWVREIHVPDLVSLVGVKEAEAFFRKALVTDKVILTVPVGDKTRKLAQDLTIEMIASVKAPQWELVTSLDSVELYEKLERRFVKAKKELALPKGVTEVAEADAKEYSRYRNNARPHYLLGLIASERTDDAYALIKQTGIAEMQISWVSHELVDLSRKGYALPVYKFFHTLLTENPELKYWETYTELAVHVGRTDEMLKLLKTSAAESGIGVARQLAHTKQLADAYLAAGDVKEGVELLLQVLAMPYGPSDADTMTFFDTNRERMSLQLMRIGHLKKNETWLEQGIKHTKAVHSRRVGPNDYYRWFSESDLVALLLELGRGPEAEIVVLESLKRAIPATGVEYHGVRSVDTLRGHSIALAEIYHEASRHSDVLTLLDTASNWGAKDLSGLLHSSAEKRLALLAAMALKDAEREKDALRILEAIIHVARGYDPAYEAYVNIRGSEAIPFLESLYLVDRFEERPLIWKAHLLRKAKKLDEAEKAAMQAVAIDPSDGDQGEGDRMRVYAELAAIHGAQGDVKEQKYFNEIIDAIRLAEKADEFYAAGLLQDGIDMYRDALAHFSNAYCVQSRLAINLEVIGNYEEAAKHYQKAFELMPDSFGRIESHCFGCEGVFRTRRARGIAEDVFSALVKTRPDKPQVHYLMGYLRKNQYRRKEALKHFRKAVELDPAYLNAWKSIAELGKRMQLPTADRDAAALKMMELDPLKRHVRPDVSSVFNMRKLHSVVKYAEDARIEEPKTLYKLTASAAKIEAAAQKNPALRGPVNPMHHSAEEFGSFENGEGLAFAVILAEHGLIRPVLDLMDPPNSY